VKLEVGGHMCFVRLDVGCWMLDVGCWVFGAGCWAQALVKETMYEDFPFNSKLVVLSQG
jgi:hypothetical protein